MGKLKYVIKVIFVCVWGGGGGGGGRFIHVITLYLALIALQITIA